MILIKWNKTGSQMTFSIVFSDSLGSQRGDISLILKLQSTEYWNSTSLKAKHFQSWAWPSLTLDFFPVSCQKRNECSKRYPKISKEGFWKFDKYPPSISLQISIYRRGIISWKSFWLFGTNWLLFKTFYMPSAKLCAYS